MKVQQKVIGGSDAGGEDDGITNTVTVDGQ